MQQPVHLDAKLQLFSDHWSPHTVGRFNDLEFLVVKAQGEFV